MIKPRAQIGDPGSDLALEQGCSCLLNFVNKECLVHGDVDAYVVEFRYLGRKKLLGHPNSFIHIPIRTVIKFYCQDKFYDAVGEWTTSHRLLETSIYKRTIKKFETLSNAEIQKRESLKDIFALELVEI